MIRVVDDGRGVAPRLPWFQCTPAIQGWSTSGEKKRQDVQPKDVSSRTLSITVGSHYVVS